MAKGWVSLHRQIQDHWLWEDKPFSKGQAWLDLIMLANHKENKVLFAGELKTCEVGTVNRSILSLAERWGWSRHKTTDFLELLNKDNMVVLKRTTKGTTVTIVNYSLYQDMPTTDGQQKDNKRTTKGQLSDTNNNDNNVNKEINTIGGFAPKEVVSLFHTICPSFPKVRTISNARKKAINARLKTVGIEGIKEAFLLAEQSSFLKGKNNRNWMADFDWIMKDANISKILDGKYNQSKNNKNNDNAEIEEIW